MTSRSKILVCLLMFFSLAVFSQDLAGKWKLDVEMKEVGALHKLATLVGERTAGKMLSSTVITVKDSWSVLLPVADYYTSNRFHIEQKGVTPDIKVKSEEALDYVLKLKD